MDPAAYQRGGPPYMGRRDQEEEVIRLDSPSGSKAKTVISNSQQQRHFQVLVPMSSDATDRASSPGTQIKECSLGPRQRRVPLRLLDEMTPAKKRKVADFSDDDFIEGNIPGKENSDYEEDMDYSKADEEGGLARGDQQTMHMQDLSKTETSHSGKEKIRDCDKDAKQLRKERNDARKEVNLIKAEKRALKAEIKILKEDFTQTTRDAGEKIAQLEQRLFEQEQTFSRAQKSVFKLLRKGNVKVETDEEVRGQISYLRSLCKRWAKEYAKHSLQEIEPGDLSKAFRGLTPDAIFASGAKLFKKSEKLPSILVNSLLSHGLSGYIIAKPFFFLGHATTKNLPAGLEKCLSLMLEMSKSIDITKAHAWRAQMLLLLQSSDTRGISEKGLEVKNIFHELKETSYEKMTRRLEVDIINGGLLKALGNAETEKRHADLLYIVHEVGEMACSLWMQKTDIRLVTLNSLSTRVFNIGSTEVEPHRSLLLEEDDTSMDGCAIDFVVEPAIYAYGNQDGENYDEYKVWAKAVVMLYQPKKQFQNVSSRTTSTKQGTASSRERAMNQSQPLSSKVPKDHSNTDPQLSNRLSGKGVRKNTKSDLGHISSRAAILSTQKGPQTRDTQRSAGSMSRGEESRSSQTLRKEAHTQPTKRDKKSPRPHNAGMEANRGGSPGDKDTAILLDDE